MVNTQSAFARLSVWFAFSMQTKVFLSNHYIVSWNERVQELSMYWTPLTGPMSNSNSVWSSNKQISRHNLSKHLCRNLYYFPKLHRDRIHAWILLGLGVYLFFLGVRMKRFLWSWKKLCRLFFFCWIWQRAFPCHILDQDEVICCFAVVVFPHPFGPMISTAPNVSNLSFKRLSTILALYSYSNFCF